MSFDFRAYNETYLKNAEAGNPAINDAAAYGVRLIPVEVAVGESYWRITEDLSYRFEGLAPGTDRVEAIGPCLQGDNVRLDKDNPEAMAHLSV